MTHAFEKTRTVRPPFPWPTFPPAAPQPGQVAVAFRGRRCLLHLDHYPTSGRRRLTLLDAGDGSRVTIASLELPGLRPADLAAFARRRGFQVEQLVLIQDWDRNEGLLEALLAAGLVEDTGATVPTGVVQDRHQARVCRLLVA